VADGTVWALNQGNIWSYSGSGWSQVPGGLTQVSIGSATNVWGVNSALPEWLWQWNGSQWAQIAAPSTFTPIQVSAGEDGTVYALDQRSYIFHWLGGAWQTIPGGLSQISVGLSDRFFYSSTAVTPQGSWSTVTNANAAAGGYLESSNTGDSLSFTFTGDSFALYRLMDSNGGQATVTVDGKAMGAIDFFFPQQQTGTNTQMWQIPAVLDHLGAGQHKLTLTVSGNHDTASNTGSSAYNSNGNNVYIDCFVVPAPFAASADQQAALTRVNFYRNQAGLPPAGLATALDLSAQAHANYNSTNPTNYNLTPHNETIGDQGFVGVDFWNRTSYFGYNPANPVSEDAAQNTAAASVDEWVNTIYHRLPIMSYLYTDIGFGLSQLNGNLNTVIDFGNLSGVAPASRVINTYPVSNQTNVPTTWSGEGPCPVPNCGSTQGSPITVQITQPASANLPGKLTAPSSFELTDPSGKVVTSILVDAGTENPGTILTQSQNYDTFALVPNAALNPATTYTASITGTDSQGNAFGPVTWSFTTIPNADITWTGASSIESTSVVISAITAGPSTSMSSYNLVYGTTASYGMQASAFSTDQAQYPNTGWVQLTGLTPGATYHYQITTTDAQGGTWTSPDATFVTTSVAQ
jgi:uncharacterized protein YkwD